MHIDFKITTWDRVHILKKDESVILKAIENGELETMEEFNALGVDGSWEKLDDVDIHMTVEENNGAPTLEVWMNNDEKIHVNSEEVEP